MIELKNYASKLAATLSAFTFNYRACTQVEACTKCFLEPDDCPKFARDAEMVQETVQQLHREIRTASYLLHPPLQELGLW